MVVSDALRFREQLLEWSYGNTRDFPWREDDSSLYEVLMAEFFLARTRADVVNGMCPTFIERYPNITTLRQANQQELAKVIRPTGLQNRRSAALKEIAEAVAGGGLPTNPEELRKLPRVGEYVGNATLCFALNQPLPIIDTNVERIFERVLGDEWPDGDAEQMEFLNELVPEYEARRYNLALLDFGAKVCSAQSPDCESCFAGDYCAYYSGERAEDDSTDR